MIRVRRGPPCSARSLTPDGRHGTASPRTRRRRVLGGDEGQATFEFLMIFPIFVLLVLLAIDFGMLMYNYVSVANAVREGARFGAVNCGTGTCTDTLVRDRAAQRSSGLLKVADVSVGWLDRGANGTRADRGDSVIVKTASTYKYKMLFFPVSIPVVSCVDMRLEQTDRSTTLSAGSSC